MDIQLIAVSVIPILIAITFHEAAHAFAAYKLGDKTAKFLGRMTLNPFVHIDLFGTILIPAMLFISSGGRFTFGYAKPVPINPLNFSNPRRDMALSAAAGPAMNLLLAIVCVLLIKFLLIPISMHVSEAFGVRVLDPLYRMLRKAIDFNVVLAAFNLIPIPPLDGGRIAVGLLPEDMARSYSRIEPYGMLILIALIFTRLTDYFVIPLIELFDKLLRLL